MQTLQNFWGKFKNSSRTAPEVCYNKGTEAGSNEVADAVEISADNPTVTPVTRCFPQKRGHKSAAALPGPLLVLPESSQELSGKFFIVF